MRAVTASKSSQPYFPRPIPAWFVTTTTGTPRALTRARASPEPGTSWTSSGRCR